MLQNADSIVGSGSDTQRLAALLAAYALGDPYPDATPVELPVETLEAAQGVYRIDDQATRTLRLVDGKMTSQRTGGASFTIIPIGNDRFVFENSLTYLTLERDSEGTITGMRIFPNGEGSGQLALLTDEPLPAARSSITVPVEQLQRLTGIYLAGGMRMTVSLDGEQLKTQLDGQPAFDLFAETAQRFFLTVVDATLEFAPEEGRAETVTLRQGGAVIEFTRSE